MRIFGLALMGIVGLLGATAVSAQDASQSAGQNVGQGPGQVIVTERTPERCAMIGPATERLVCYDGLYRNYDLASGSVADQDEVGFWASGIEVSQISGTEVPFATLQSEQLIPALPRGRAPARLAITCVDGKTSVQMMFAGQAMGTANSNSAPITIQFDRQPGRSRSLLLSSDRNALVFYDNEAAIEFIGQLQEAEKLFIRVQPQQQRSLTVSFNLQGLDEALMPVREVCGW